MWRTPSPPGSLCCSIIAGCAGGGQESEYRELVDHYVALCGNNHLILNVNKTKETIFKTKETRF